MGYTFEKRKPSRKTRVPAVQPDKSKEQTLPNSLVMRIMEDQQAENEADALSKGVTATTPDDIMREMGSRLGADFSGVQFHSDTMSLNRSNAMGARAWTQGSDVYFGKGGFDPQVAAHELVHTVQQGAVRGNVSQSMPMGAVQMKPMKDTSRIEDDETDENIKVERDSDYQAILTQIFNTQNGRRIYHALESDLYKLIRKGAGRDFRRCSQADGINFLVQAAEKDYTGKMILANIMMKSTQTAHFARKRLYDYQEFVQFLSNRLRESDLEEAAMSANVMAGPPKYEHNQPKDRKRAYELDVPGKDSDQINFNPTNDPELEQVQRAIQNAANEREAYNIFGRFAGNSSAKYVNKVRQETNLADLKKKLMNMARVVRDYPELQGQIGDMTVADPKKDKYYMGAVGTFGGLMKAQLLYNAYRDTDAGREERDAEFSSFDNKFLTGNKDFAGTHELGHVLAKTLIDTDQVSRADLEQNAGYHETRILEKVLSNPDVMPAEDYKKLRRYTAEDEEKSKIEETVPTRLKNSIHTAKNRLFTKGYTSRYGAESPQEFIAEAFHDVYANGNKARKASVATVQEYERRQKNLTTKKFFRGKRSLWRRFWNWVKM